MEKDPEVLHRLLTVQTAELSAANRHIAWLSAQQPPPGADLTMHTMHVGGRGNNSGIYPANKILVN